ncbi:lactosylceramide 4-alpha-galactosyltransferase-like isoform X2 [Trichoplusia ni]|uniref:Lactosylceramide 4-alpha-galactosyltransferase-like isoform X2 n=1 Tax=Trichoplusia ni TaxID=7111 RepID=A0A7E5VLI7_TRINI|nr:lactosylceramide 4-alpha-galactosyltransferase-like isoform X2 [Trichoplusia ni]
MAAPCFGHIACSIEAAARTHPKREVYVLFSAPVSENVLKRSCLAKLLQFDNIKAARVHIDMYAKGSTIEPILLDLDESNYPIQHTSDILRILTLNKWGGIYLDTDMIVVKSLDELPPNWVAKQSDFSLASGILSFAKDEVGRNVTKRILELLSQNFDPYDWIANGPYIVQNAVLPLCMTGNISENCNGIKIMPYELFYPLHYSLWKFFFRVETFSTTESPYSYHMWNYLSSAEKIEKGSLYQVLAKKYCPSIYELYGEDFGM